MLNSNSCRKNNIYERRVVIDSNFLIFLLGVLVVYESQISSIIAYCGNRIGLRGSNVGSIIFWLIFIGILFIYSIKYVKINSTIFGHMLALVSLMLIYLLIGIIKSPNSYIIDHTSFSIIEYLFLLPLIVFIFAQTAEFDKLLLIFSKINYIIIPYTFLIWFVEYYRCGYSIWCKSMARRIRRKSFWNKKRKVELFNSRSR